MSILELASSIAEEIKMRRAARPEPTSPTVRRGFTSAERKARTAEFVWLDPGEVIEDVVWKWSPESPDWPPSRGKEMWRSSRWMN